MQDKEHGNIYIIGIGGKGLNSIAEFCHSKGYAVSGSDIRLSPEVSNLRRLGVHINLEQVSANITPGVGVVVYSTIIRNDHPELMRARELGIRTVCRAEFLAEITAEYVRISVAGSHGKSTTSALATLALRSELGGVNAITGACIKEIDSYQSSGDSEYCVLEACEYGKSFLHIPGDYTIITSLEKSHMEYFGSEEKMNNAFREFVAVHKPGATLIVNGDVCALREMCGTHPGTVVTCGFNTSNDYVIRDIVLGEAHSMFSLYKHGRQIQDSVIIKIPGMYNVMNVALTLVLMDQLGLGSDEFLQVLKSFTGVGRRFEITRHDTATFVDDFAHHPTQVRNLLKSLKQFFPHKEIIAIFEPRQFHLIRTFLKEYGKAFSLASEVCITDVLPALGDTLADMSSLTAQDVVRSVQAYSKPKRIWHASSYEEIAESLRLKDLSQTVVATIGAGGIFRVRDLVVNRVQ